MSNSLCDPNPQYHAFSFCYTDAVFIYLWGLALKADRRGMGHGTPFWSPWTYPHWAGSTSPCIFSPYFRASSSRIWQFKVCFTWRFSSMLVWLVSLFDIWVNSSKDSMRLFHGQENYSGCRHFIVSWQQSQLFQVHSLHPFLRTLLQQICVSSWSNDSNSTSFPLQSKVLAFLQGCSWSNWW